MDVERASTEQPWSIHGNTRRRSYYTILAHSVEVRVDPGDQTAEFIPLE
jgi:hypothetical protein